MKDYLLIYSTDLNNMPKGSSPEQMQALTKQWMDWIGGITAQSNFTDREDRKECIVGYSIMKAISIEEVKELIKYCPILDIGGQVEVREITVL